MTFDRDLLMFWGKTPPHPDDPPEQFHPAIYHMLDVAFVAEALLHSKPVPRLQRALSHSWSNVPWETCLAWLPLLIALHDLGKISAPFQGQQRDGRAKRQRERLERLGFEFPASYEPHHAAISAVWIKEHLHRREPRLDAGLVPILRDAMGGHHGRFLQTTMRPLLGSLRSAEGSHHSSWNTYRTATFDLLRQILAPPADTPLLARPPHPRAATAVLTGFIILCDWIGSNADFFPVTSSDAVGLTDYVPLSRTRAQASVSHTGLAPERQPVFYGGFQTVFPDVPAPRPLQEAVDMIPDQMIAPPLLIIIEAPTGEGKTEAALALAQRIAAVTGIPDLFFALPTMATSNQIFLRLSRFIKDRFGETVTLTHSQASVMQDELRRIALAHDSDAADTNGASLLGATEWFAGSKKALLAPFGVGTVDQVELAGLNVRHYVLRLLALSQNVVIIDEIHAYDTYMNTILEHTLTWLAQLGTSVILLSATLPLTRHQALVQSYLRGRGHPVAAVPQPLPYPAMSVYTPVQIHRVFPASFRSTHRFTLRLQSVPNADEEARQLLALVRHGGAVARICNRVDDAQAIYRALLDMAPVDMHHMLIHARFPLRERQEREQRLDTWLGNATQRTPDQPIIVIGTQVLEQSLDYDVDVMVTDFAPLDFLLQRAGRLHRHERHTQRPDPLREPTLHVVVHLDAGGLPLWQRWERIYDPYILWRSWETLTEHGHQNSRQMVLPQDYRPLIEAVYADAPVLTEDGSYASDVRAAWTKLQQVQGEMRSKAQQQLTPDVTIWAALTEGAPFDFVEDDRGALASWQIAKTRLGDSITVLPVYRQADGRWFLDRVGSLPISPDIPPRHTDINAYLARTIPVSDPRIVAWFRDERACTMRWAWGSVPPLLRYVYPLILDTNGVTTIDKRRVTLDLNLGLVIEKELL